MDVETSPSHRSTFLPAAPSSEPSSDLWGMPVQRPGSSHEVSVDGVGIVDLEAEAIPFEVAPDVAEHIGLTLPAKADPHSRGASRGSSGGLPVTGNAGTPTRGKQQGPRDLPLTGNGAKKSLQAGGRPLADWDGDEQFVERVRALLGLQPLNVHERCILPATDGPRTSWIWLDRRGLYVYSSKLPIGTTITLPLAAVHGSLIFERIYIPGPKDPILATFKGDLLICTGSVPAPSVILPLLPAGASRLDHHLRQRVTDLFAAKWAVELGAPTMLARTFLGEWARVTPDQARDAVERLRDWGIIELARKELHGGHLSNLWLPGRAT